MHTWMSSWALDFFLPRLTIFFSSFLSCALISHWCIYIHMVYWWFISCIQNCLFARPLSKGISTHTHTHAQTQFFQSIDGINCHAIYATINTIIEVFCSGVFCFVFWSSIVPHIDLDAKQWLLHAYCMCVGGWAEVLFNTTCQYLIWDLIVCANFDVLNKIIHVITILWMLYYAQQQKPIEKSLANNIVAPFTWTIPGCIPQVKTNTNNAWIT